MMQSHPKPANRELVSASLKLLAMRDMSRVEFERKLGAKEFTPEEIAEAVVWCVAEGWLNESRYAEGAARRLGQKYGAARVAQSLKQKGVTEEVVAETLDAMKDSELRRAQEIWQRKFGEVATGADARARQIRYLQSRGFRYEVVKRAISGEPLEEE